MNFELQSTEIDKLTAAFVEAKKEFLPFKATAKGNWGPYVSIDDMRAATNDALIKHGVKLTQDQAFSEFNGGTVFLVTKLAHGNQWERSFMPIYIPANPRSIDQAYGSSFSYQRRYALYNLFGIKGEDLDPDSTPEIKEPLSLPSESKSEFISEKQKNFLLKKLTEKENGAVLGSSLSKKFNFNSFDQIKWRDFNDILKMIE